MSPTILSTFHLGAGVIFEGEFEGDIEVNCSGGFLY
jgi:hypothetical protein